MAFRNWPTAKAIMKGKELQKTNLLYNSMWQQKSSESARSHNFKTATTETKINRKTKDVRHGWQTKYGRRERRPTANSNELQKTNIIRAFFSVKRPPPQSNAVLNEAFQNAFMLSIPPPRQQWFIRQVSRANKSLSGWRWMAVRRKQRQLNLFEVSSDHTSA